MSRFDRTESNLIEKVVREKTSAPKIGIVDQVFEHTATDDDSNFEINVLTDGKTNKYKRVPVYTPGSDIIAPPKKGDKVMVFFTGRDSNRPIAMGTGWSRSDRPPIAQAGMFKNRFESGESALGVGDLHLTGYTSYDDNVASIDKRELTPEQSLIQIAKHEKGDNIDPENQNDIPLKVEVFDNPKDNEGHVSIEINAVGGDETDSTWGLKFDFKTGEFKLVDSDGYGITSDGSGNFNWNYKSLNYQEEPNGGSLSL